MSKATGQGDQQGKNQALAIDQEFPHQVEIRVPGGGLGSTHTKMFAFCQELDYGTRSIGRQRRVELGGNDAMVFQNARRRRSISVELWRQHPAAAHARVLRDTRRSLISPRQFAQELWYEIERWISAHIAPTIIDQNTPSLFGSDRET